MFDSLIASIQSYGTFSDTEIDDLLNYIEVKKINNGESILEPGEICRELSYLHGGSFIQSFKDDKLNEVIINLYTQGDWVMNHTSFTGQKPSLHSIKAFEDSTIYVLSIHDLHALIGKYPSFFALGKLLEVIDYQSNQQLTPDQKYQALLEEKPRIIQTFPLKYIASFLGMTPETLSRVRNRIK